MEQTLKLSRASFALGLIALGVLGLVYGDFALQWQPVPTWVPARGLLAFLSAGTLLAMGAGLVSQRALELTSRVVMVYVLLWFLLLDLPRLTATPLVEARWLSAGEISVIVAAGLVLFASSGEQQGAPRFARGEGGVRIARFVMAIALIPIGLSHFVYPVPTIAFVPAWLPFRAGWANLGGAGHIAAGVGMLVGVYPRLAARLEAAMIGVFTVLAWLPRIIAAPTDRLQWTGMIMSWTIGAAAWVVAESLAGADGPAPRGGATGGSLPASSIDLATTNR